MNYLAHIFLSGIEETVLIGNFIGDYVKGKDYVRYPDSIRKGIVLHRRIDSFTDTHKIVSQSKRYFAPEYHKWAGIVTDILYDHYLILHWDKFCPVSLDEYKEDIFDVLQKYYPVLPERVKYFVPSFIQNDWINTYSTPEGIVNVLYSMSLRTPLPDKSQFAAEVIKKYYIQLDSEFMTFFIDLLKYVVSNFQVTIPLVDNKIAQEINKT
jgi:acyl carrier protein phosphodiesterase